MNYDALKLENQICFSLYAASKEIIKQYKPYLDPLGITYTQYIVLLVLWQQDNISIKQLCEPLLLDTGTLTPLLKKLESQGLIKRVRSVSDERNVYISLTLEGQSLKDKALEIPKSIFCASGLSIDEAILLNKQLKQLLQNINNN